MRYLEDERGGGVAERQPQHSARLGAAFRVPQDRSARPASTACSRTARWPRCATPCRRVCRSPPPCRGRARGLRPTATRWSARSSPTIGSGLTGRSRPRWRCARSSARSRRCCSRRWTRSLAGTAVESAAWAFAAHWGADWLRRAQRLAPPPVRPVAIMVGDATRGTSSIRTRRTCAHSSCSACAPG